MLRGHLYNTESAVTAAFACKSARYIHRQLLTHACGWAQGPEVTVNQLL
jgi:hypothetical protein